MQDDEKLYSVEPGNKPALGFADAAEQIAERMQGLPKAVWDGQFGRMVPVAYDVEIVQLVSDEEHRARELQARDALAAGKARNARMMSHANACLNRYVHAQQSDDGIGVAFMTRSERELASMEWGKRLRDLIEAGKRRNAEQERNRVVVDLQWDD